MLVNLAFLVTGVVIGVYLSPPARSAVQWAYQKVKGLF